MQYKKVFTVQAEATRALEYIADFRTLTQWEPSVQSAKQTHGQGPGVQAAYEIQMRFLGQDSVMSYSCTEYAPEFAVLVGKGDGFTAYDRIDVRPLPLNDGQAQGQGCEVTYFTDITLTGKLGRAFEPVIAIIFGFNVRRAVRNMQACLNS